MRSLRSPESASSGDVKTEEFDERRVDGVRAFHGLRTSDTTDGSEPSKWERKDGSARDGHWLCGACPRRWDSTISSKRAVRSLKSNDGGPNRAKRSVRIGPGDPSREVVPVGGCEERLGRRSRWGSRRDQRRDRGR